MQYFGAKWAFADMLKKLTIFIMLLAVVQAARRTCSCSSSSSSDSQSCNRRKHKRHSCKEHRRFNPAPIQPKPAITDAHDIAIPINFEMVVRKWPTLGQLIIVAGQATQFCTEYGKNPQYDGSCWLFADDTPHQRRQFPTFAAMVHKGVQLASRSPGSLLVLSGGVTRVGTGARSEARSMYAIAEHKKFFGYANQVQWRTTTEDFARDSFENVIFSAARFAEVTGHYPRSITVVGPPQQSSRYLNYVAPALGLGPSNFTYYPVYQYGYDASTTLDYDLAKYYTLTNGACPAALAQERINRNPYGFYPGYIYSCSELVPFLSFCNWSGLPNNLLTSMPTSTAFPLGLARSYNTLPTV